MTATALDRIRAISRRDMKLKLSYPFDLLTSFWGIAVSVFMFFFIGQLVGDTPLISEAEGGYFAYAVVGVTVMGIAYATIGVFTSTFRSEMANGTLELLLSSSTRLRDILLGSLTVPFVFAGVQALGYFGLGWALAPDSLHPLAWVRALPVLILIVLSFAAIGLFSAAMVIVAQRGDPVGVLFAEATNLLAGAVFPVALMPEWLQVVARFIPTFYGFEALRSLMLADASWASVADELAILAAFDVALAVIGVWLLRKALRFARVMGTLGTA